MTLPPQATSGDLHNGSSAGTGSTAPIGDTARELAEQAKREGAVKADAFRTTTSQKVNAIAEGARAAAGALKQEDVAQMSQYLERFAGSLQHLSSTIREKSGEELLQETNRLARENPTMFMAACVAIGFGLGRFAKAAPPEQRATNGSTGANDMAGSSATMGGSASPTGTSTGTGASSVGSSSTSGSHAGGTTAGLGGTAAAGSTPGVSEFSGSSSGPGASSVGEGAGTAGSRLAGGSGMAGSGSGPESWRSSSDAASGTGGTNITNDEAGGLSS